MQLRGGDDSGIFSIPAGDASDVAQVSLPAAAAAPPAPPQRAETPLSVPATTEARIELPPMSPARPGAREKTAPRSRPGARATRTAAIVTEDVRSELAEARPHGFAGEWHEVVVSARKLTLPTMCACCLGPADASWTATLNRRKGARETVHHWTFPYCSVCLSHANRAQSGIRFARALAILTGVVLAVTLPFFLSFIVAELLAVLLVGAVWLGVGALLISRVRRTMSPDCAYPGPAVHFAGLHGSVNRFLFANERFALAFSEANIEKLL